LLRTRLLLQTEREAPAEAEIVSHRLLLRAGMIRKVAAGVYTFMPLGMRVLDKVMAIVRREMDAAGAQEMLMPALQPADLWQRSGRWDQYGKEMMRLSDRHDREFALGPTHEELVTSLVAAQVSSYRQLPLNVYQIQGKFRDEIRPRFGLMRAREFFMKDAYSFDIDDEGLAKSYDAMYEAYTKIFTACGLDFRPVQASTGMMGGASSHEFHVLADTGEEEIAFCDACDYAANTEVAIYTRPQVEHEDVTALEEVSTPGKQKVDEVSEFLGVDPGRLIKTLIYQTENGPKAVLIPGDREANAEKLLSVLGEDPKLMEAENIQKQTGIPFGFAGPVGLKIPVVADYAVAEMVNAITGANKKDHHFTGVNPGRDFEVDETADLQTVNEGDRCPECEGTISICRGIETGHLFKLGTKYSEALDATFNSESGQIKPMIMGSYGIGVGRMIAAAVEQYNDDRGILWPAPIAPFQVTILPLVKEGDDLWLTAHELHDTLEARGVEVLMDDRKESAGIKFADADLIGVPIQVIIGKKTT